MGAFEGSFLAADSGYILWVGYNRLRSYVADEEFPGFGCPAWPKDVMYGWNDRAGIRTQPQLKTNANPIGIHRWEMKNCRDRMRAKTRSKPAVFVFPVGQDKRLDNRIFSRTLMNPRVSLVASLWPTRLINGCQ